MSKIAELLALFDNVDEIERYKKFEKTINGDKVLKKRFAEMKALQKQLVNAKAIQKKNAIIQFESEYEALRGSIEQDPLIETYLEMQNEINDLLVEIKEIIETEINKEIMLHDIKSE